MSRSKAAATTIAALALILTSTLAAEAQSVSVGGTTVTSKGLVAVGRIPAPSRDKFGETFGSGSGMWLDQSAFKRNGDTYEGTLYLLPDRGYNVEGTTDYRPRVNTITFTMKPVNPGAAGAPEELQATLKATLADTMLLTDDEGRELSGLDPNEGVRAPKGKFPALPQASNGKLSLDPEAILKLADGTLLISDEYCPCIYRFSATGKLLGVTPPSKALLPLRKGKLNFASNNPGPGASKPDPANPEFGRQNNQGLEGMALTPSGKFVVAVLQSATRQDGGDSPATRNHTRALVFDATDPSDLKLVREHVVPLPVFKDKDRTLVAAQSELVALSDTQFLMLSRDSNNGYGMKGATSLYRSIDILELDGASNLVNTPYSGDVPVAPKGVLNPEIVPAKLTKFIDINEQAQLDRFGLHNGAPNDRNNLSEKWEAMSLAPALDPAAPNDYFLFVANDNDFITQSGFQVGAAYKDESGVDNDTVFLVYRLTLPLLATK